MNGGYWIGYWITWVIVFIGLWVFAVFEYGYLLGVGLGWLPAAIISTLTSFLWPIAVVALIVLLFVVVSPDITNSMPKIVDFSIVRTIGKFLSYGMVIFAGGMLIYTPFAIMRSGTQEEKHRFTRGSKIIGLYLLWIFANPVYINELFMLVGVNLDNLKYLAISFYMLWLLSIFFILIYQHRSKNRIDQQYK